jgi:RsiW-degrading membrane proteinase PrsW (M82 family)
MVLLALSIAPGIAICIFIYVKDKHNKEPIWLVLISFILGMLSTIPAVIIQSASGISLESLAGKSYQQVALFAFGVVAISEELSKFVMVRYFAYRRKAFDDPFDGIVYAVMVSMGFATLENIGYVLQHGFATGIVRMFISVPAHATFGILMGYFLGLAKFNSSNKIFYQFLSIFFPVLFHGSFNFFLFLGNNWLHVFGALASFIIAIRLSKKAIRKHQAKSYTIFNP